MIRSRMDVFDFVEGFTVISSQSRIIFPVLEPFGHDLDYVYSQPGSNVINIYFIHYMIPSKRSHKLMQTLIGLN